MDASSIANWQWSQHELSPKRDSLNLKGEKGLQVPAMDITLCLGYLQHMASGTLLLGVSDLCERYQRLSGFRWRVQQAELAERSAA